MQKVFYIVEPFPLFGVGSVFHSKEQAEKVLKHNSYYIFVAGFICLLSYFAIIVGDMDIGINKEYILFFASSFFVIAYFIRKHQSRAASIISLLIFSSTFFVNYYENGSGGFYVFTLLFIAACYRSIKASFYYHKSK